VRHDERPHNPHLKKVKKEIRKGKGKREGNKITWKKNKKLTEPGIAQERL